MMCKIIENADVGDGSSDMHLRSKICIDSLNKTKIKPHLTCHHLFIWFMCEVVIKKNQ